MKKITFLSFLFLFSSFIMAQNKTEKHADEWAAVYQFETDGLPKSALNATKPILKKAIADKDCQQVIKALIHLNKYNMERDYRENKKLINDLETLVSKNNVASENALINSMLAQLYNSYYNKVRWKIRANTNLESTPENMDMWTTLNFTEKMIEKMDLSIQNKEELVKHTTAEFEDIIELGDASREYYPTLYDFLMSRSILMAQNVANTERYNTNSEKETGYSLKELAVPANQFKDLKLKEEKTTSNYILLLYQQYFNYLMDKDMTSTLIFTEIDKVKFLLNTNDEIEDSLESLLKLYQQNEASNEIIYELATNRRYNNDNKVSEKTYNLCNEGLDKYPNYKNNFQLKQVIQNLENPKIELSIERETQYIDSDFEIKIEHRNARAKYPNASFALVSIEGDKYIHIRDYNPELKSEKSYTTDTTKLSIKGLRAGKYKLAYIKNPLTYSSMEGKIKEAEKEQNTLDILVTDLFSFHRTLPNQQYEIYIVNAKTGQPIEGVSVKAKHIIEDKYTDKGTYYTYLKTDKMGLALLTDEHNTHSDKRYGNTLTYDIALANDTCNQDISLYRSSYHYDPSQEEKSNTTISIFTDRSIYRPGQTVYFKAVATNKDNAVIANKKLEVLFKDANSEKVKELELTTNDFGSISGSFVIPQNGLLGFHQIEVKNASIYIRVEEYKRPTFEITFDKIKETYAFGQEITVKGNAKTFSGVNLQNTEVQFTINRRNAFPFYRKGMQQNLFKNGTTQTDEAGNFTIKFTPQPTDHNDKWWGRNTFAFNIEATINAENDEQQSGNHTVIVSDVSMQLNIEMVDQLEKSSDYKIGIKAYNLSWEEIDTKGTYSVFSLNKNDSIKTEVLKGKFESGLQTDLKNKLNSLASGKYRIKVKALDDNKKEVSAEKDFMLFSYKDKHPPIETNVWIVGKTTEFDKSNPAEVIYGTSRKNSHILYEIYNDKKVFHREFIKLSNKNHTFTLPYKAEYGAGVYISFMTVKDGKLESNNIRLTLKEETLGTELKVEMSVFRDKLKTGQAETWTVNITNKDGKSAMAEILASMYDKSIDKLSYPLRWQFNRAYKNRANLSTAYFQSSHYHSWSQRYLYIRGLELGDGKETDYKPLEFDRINWYGYPAINTIISNSTLRSRMYKSKSSNEEKSAADMPEGPTTIGSSLVTGALAGHVPGLALQEESTTVGYGSQIRIRGAASRETEDIQIRKNFDETAFFFPQLRTNEKGETLISFTTPESNTKWKFRILAHDKQSRVGTLERDVVTQKELMVSPNMPRFMRQGDETSISTSISNLSDGALLGNVKIEFFNPVTDKILDLQVSNQSQAFSLEKDATTSARWTFNVPQDIELIGCRIVASSGTFSDGEQHALAVLPNRMLVTEAKPFEITKTGETKVVFDKLKNNKSETLDNYKLTLEYANNPAWYAVMALPSMSLPNSANTNAVNWCASDYVNGMGASIAIRYPEVSRMIKAWKQQGGTKETLLSKLNQNAELKAVMMQETPWVLEAKNEEEQMQRLSDLFNLNDSEERIQTALNKLEELQHPNGGWQWYKGFTPSRSITQYILLGFQQMQLAGQIEQPQQAKEMQIKALNYLDESMVKDFSNLKKRNDKWEEMKNINTHRLEYLYVRSLYRDIPISIDAREAERFYTEVVTKNWTKLGLYEKSILSVLLRKNGEKDLAHKIAQSIREHAIKDKSLGMYWPNLKYNVFLSMSAVSAHTFMMEALIDDGASKTEIDHMKRWLVQQKRTQVWESTHATLDAINMLISTGSEWYEGDKDIASLVVGGKEVNSAKANLGIGYTKTSWSGTEIDKSMADLKVTTNSTTPAYGAMYWQYFEDLDKVTAQSSDFSIQKEMFKKVTKDGQVLLEKITSNNPIQVGDKVTMRLTLHSNDNVEYVHVKDMRAACFEPIPTLSGIKWNGRISYCEETRDASTNFFINKLPKGTYVLEYDVYANRLGEYSNGITSMQCLYAPEYISNTAGIKVVVKNKE